MSTANRIIKNSIYLFIKMCVTMFVSLYTTRIVLQSLGASDFGVFNIIGGSIAMLGFLNSTLAYATQRFMTYAKGEGNLEKQSKIFNISLLLHMLIAIVTMLIQIALMYPLFNGILNIASGRELAAKVVYISLIISTGVHIINATYDAVMNAHENMRFYSIIGIIDAILKLLVAFACLHTCYDKLILYGILMSMVPIIIFLITSVYCHKRYIECVISLKTYWDVAIVKDITTFSIWNFFTAVSSLFSVQGVGLIMNHFYGSALNAAQGIAVQLNGYLSAFAANMLKAINPVIVKNAGANDLTSMNHITILSCKYATYLIILFAIPCILEINFLLKFWLGNVPVWTALFCILQIIQALILQMSGPVATAVYGQGSIKYFSILKTTMNLLPLLVTYIAFRFNAAPYWIYIPMIILYAVGGNIIILYFASKNCSLSYKEYLRGVILPVFIVILFMLILGAIPVVLMLSSFYRLCITILFSTVGFTISAYLFGMQSYEKNYIKSMLIKIKSNYLDKIFG